jgi:hypothetical protein
MNTFSLYKTQIMSLHSLQLNHNLKGSIQSVYPSVLDMRLFGKHHPYMTEVKLLQSTNEFSEYDIKEKVLLFGFIPQRPRYTAKVFEIEKGKHIRYTSLIQGKIDLTIDFNFTHDQSTNITSLNESIVASGNVIACKILIGLMGKSHRILFNEMALSLNK